MTSYESSDRILKLIDELILLWLIWNIMMGPNVI